jgi:hypothetical protein
MDERLKFIADYARGEWDLAELCRRYEVSRKTGCRPAPKSWNAHPFVSTRFHTSTTSVLALILWTLALYSETNLRSKFVHDLEVLPHSRCKAMSPGSVAATDGPRRQS